MRPSRKNHSPRTIRGLAVLMMLWSVALSGLPMALTARNASAATLTAYGLTTNNELVQFHKDAPSVIRSRIAVTGLQAGERLLGIDFRPATGQLYGLGSTNRIYVIDLVSGAAFAEGAPFTPALSGDSVGFDFNPVVDRIRIVTDSGQNLRLQPDTGQVAFVDGSLAYVTGDTNAGRTAGVTGAAYTNADRDPATGTVLYNIDSRRDLLVMQDPPNDGGLKTVGALGVDAKELVGFDITGATTAYAGLVADGDNIRGAALASVDLATGRLTIIGSIGQGENITGLAFPTPAPSPAMMQTAYGLTTENQLVQFSTDAPSVIRSRLAVTGLQAGERLLGIDFRPATGQLYGLGSTNRIYVIDLVSGAAFAEGAPFTPALSGDSVGFDFNPVVDRIRIVTDSGQNLRLQPDTGQVAFVDGSLAYVAGDTNAGRTAGATGAAYTNADRDPATGTVLYNIDSRRDLLVMQDPPNDGGLKTVGALGVDAKELVGFDITGATTAYAGLVADGDNIRGAAFASVDLATGRITIIGSIGQGENITGLALPTQ